MRRPLHIAAALFLAAVSTSLCASTLDGVVEGDRIGGGDVSGVFENARNGINGIIETGPSGNAPVFSVPFTTNADASDGTTPTFTRASTAYGTRVVGGEMELVEFAVNEPRVGSFLDSTGSTQNGVLIEGSAENILTYTDDFSTLAWSRAATLISSSSGVSATVESPDPTKNAFELISNSTNSTHAVRPNNTFAITASTQYAISVYARAGDKSWMRINAEFDFTGGPRANFNLTGAGSVGSTQNIDGATIRSLGGGWYRCTIIDTSSASATQGRLQFFAGVGDDSLVFAGDGSTVDLYLFGPQAEVGGGSSSYTPSTSAPTTRAADVGFHTLPSALSEPLTVAVNVLRNGDDDSANRFALLLNDGGSNANRLVLFQNVGTGRMRWLVDSSETNNAAFLESASPIAGGVWTQLIGTTETNDHEAYIDGVSFGTDTTGIPPNDLDRVYWGSDGSASHWNGWVGRIDVYNELRALP